MNFLHLKGALAISVSGPSLVQNHHWRKENYSSRYLLYESFSVRKVYIVCAAIATQHARCHKEYYSPRGRTVSTSHIWSLTCGGRFASAKRFCIFWSPSSQEKSIFHEISACETCHGCNHANLGLVQTFSVSYGSS